MSPPRVSLIVNTYNQPDYLGRVLAAVSGQRAEPHEVLLADDGSAEKTRTLFMRWAHIQSFRCEHVWQEHQGFRRARILNEAIARATGDFIVFLDGDTVPHPRFIADHQQLAQPRAFTQGHRALIGILGSKKFGNGPFESDRWVALRQFQVSGLQHAFRWPRPSCKFHEDLRGVRGCNLGIWRADLEAVNGYNEAFEGWGREDSELAVRLNNNGIRRLDVRGWALCYHLWHLPAPRANLASNDRLLDEAIASARKRCERGLDQHATRLPV